MKLTTIRPIVGSTMSLYIFDDGVEYIHAGELQSEIGYSAKSSAPRTLDRFGLEKTEVDYASAAAIKSYNPATMAKVYCRVPLVPARFALDNRRAFAAKWASNYARRIDRAFDQLEASLDPKPLQGDLIDIGPRLEAKTGSKTSSTTKTSSTMTSSTMTSSTMAPSTPAPAPDDLDVEVIFDEPEAAPAQTPASPVADPMALIRSGMEILSALGGLEARDKLMLRDATRNIIARHAGIALNSTPSVGATGYGVGNRLVELGYRYSLDVVKTIGRRVAARYRRAFNAEPQTCKRWVDGEERDVNFYVKPEAVAMLDDEIHAYFREVGS